MSLPEYYNLRCDLAEGRLDRRGFVHAWWRLYAHEPHWSPPYYPALKAALNPECNPHLKRLSPHLVCLRGVPREARQNAVSGDLLNNLGRGMALEAILACALLLYDPRRSDGCGYLALLHCQNTASALEGLLNYAAEQLFPFGARRILGPVGISPWIDSGILVNRWNQTSPAYTAYNPPFLPDQMLKVMEPGPVQKIYRLPVTPISGTPLSKTAELEEIDSSRLAGDLLALLAAAFQTAGDYPLPDSLEAGFLLNWIGHWPQWGWLAKINGQPAGFMLLQPDLSSLLQRTHGGRNVWQRFKLRLGLNQAMRCGRVVLAGVAPAFRRQGIASQMWRHAAQLAQRQGWECLIAGPFPEDSPAANFCTKYGGRPEQEYRLYSADL
jgi:GNAT superfamily N-acetyltransferase